MPVNLDEGSTDSRINKKKWLRRTAPRKWRNKKCDRKLRGRAQTDFSPPDVELCSDSDFSLPTRCDSRGDVKGSLRSLSAFYCSLMWHGELARTASARNFEENLREVFFRFSSTPSGLTRTVSINYLTISPWLHRNAFLFSSTYSRLLAEALIYCFILIYGENSLPASSFSLFLG